MRDIKFRVYSTVTGCFSYTTMQELITEDNSRISKKMFNDDLTVMQFTGLTDCNGVEVYEGDLIKEIRKNPSWDSDMVNILPVVYSAPSFMVGDLKISNDYFMITMEVIGNIHENAELLKWKNT